MNLKNYFLINNKMNVLISPDSCILKMEKFDLNMAQYLNSQDCISKVEKSRIRYMLKHRIQGNQFEAKYVLGKNVKHEYIGRWIAKTGYGLQGLSRDTRNALAKPYYWDIDFVNCQVEILRQLALKKGWKCDALSTYCDRRDDIFKEIMESYDLERYQIKELFISVLFGGNVGLSTPEWIRTVFFPEVHVIMENLSLLYPDLLKKCKKSKPDNPHGSLCANILQTEERKVLEALDRGLAIHNRTLSVLIHDGGYVERKDNEREFSRSILDRCEEYVFEQTGYNLKLDIKQIETSFIIPNTPVIHPDRTYEAMKSAFEVNHFKCIEDVCFYNVKDNKIIRMTKTDLLTIYENQFYDIVSINKKGVEIVDKRSFIEEWLKDSNMKTYNSIGFFPPPERCPQNVYNTWSGFAIEDVVSEELKEDEKADLQFLYDHILLLCNKEENIFKYVLNWISYFFQFPAKKPLVMLLFKTLQGLGKEKGLYDVIERIVGDKYCIITQNVERDILGSFNAQLRGKLFVVMNEMSLKTSCKHDDLLKELATCKFDHIRMMRQDAIDVPSFTHLMAFSNKAFPWKIEESDRRYFPIDASSQSIPDSAYFIRLMKIVDNLKILRCFYDECLSRDVSDWNAKDRPETEFMDELKELSRPMEHQFIIDFIEEQKEDITISTNDLWVKFCDYYVKNNIGIALKITKVGFSKRIKSLKIDGLELSKSHNFRGYKLKLKTAFNFLISKKWIC